MKDFFKIDERLLKKAEEIEEKCSEVFKNIEKIGEYNQYKVLSAFINNGICESHLGESTGYGYGDRGRDTLERLFAEVVGAEASLIRHNFVSGTHTLTVALFGILRPNDNMLCLTGRPYDTLIGVLGIDGHSDGSLKDFGVNYNEVPLKFGRPDTEAIKTELKNKKYKLAYIQRSRGYSLRPSLTVHEIGELCKIVKAVSPDTYIMVDNCYGEFVETKEPTQVGADIIAGSLIKNPGGGIAKTGGYIAGNAALIEKCANRLTCPGVGGEVGCTLGHNRELYMGLFAAPTVVTAALKAAIFTSCLFENLGFSVTPRFDEKRGDIIEAVTLGNEEALIAFCQGMQKGAPIDSFIVPEPWDMPGYDSKVIMAAGAFTLGSSIELSADAPLREPYAAWMQGGLNYPSAKAGILLATQSMLDKNLINL